MVPAVWCTAGRVRVDGPACFGDVRICVGALRGIGQVWESWQPARLRPLVGDVHAAEPPIARQTSKRTSSDRIQASRGGGGGAVAEGAVTVAESSGQHEFTHSSGTCR
jgi:hypothetical protein